MIHLCHLFHSYDALRNSVVTRHLPLIECLYLLTPKNALFEKCSNHNVFPIWQFIPCRRWRVQFHWIICHSIRELVNPSYKRMEIIFYAKYVWQVGRKFHTASIQFQILWVFLVLDRMHLHLKLCNLYSEMHRWMNPGYLFGKRKYFIELGTWTSKHSFHI